MSEFFDPNEWITTQEAAELTGYTRHNLTRAARTGTLNPVARGNMLFFRRNEVLEYSQRMQTLGRKKHITRRRKKEAD